MTLYGSLAYTGRAHGTDKSIVLGLTGARPATVDPEDVKRIFEQTQQHITFI